MQSGTIKLPPYFRGIRTMTIEFAPLGAGATAPFWDGEAFTFGGRRERVLAYDVGASGWTDDLTKLHEGASTEGDHFIDKASRKHALAEVRGALPPGSPTLLEVGCSSGYVLKEMRRQFPSAFVIGADYTLGTLVSLGARLPGVPLIRLDMTKCPLPDASVDVAVLLNVLEHIEDDGAAVRHIYRILKPGGTAVIEVPAGPELFDDYDRELMHFRRYTLEGLSKLFSGAGFYIRRENYFGALLYPFFRRAKVKAKQTVAGSHVANEIARSSKLNAIGDMIMTTESFLRPHVRFPAGIRCVLTATKPAPRS